MQAAPEIPRENDAFQCVDYMRRELHSLRRGFAADVILAATTIAFAELLRDCGDTDDILRTTAASHRALPYPTRSQIRLCHRLIKALIAATRKAGFADHAILWAMHAAILSVMQTSGLEERHIEKTRAAMLHCIKDLRNPTTD